jgi:hypothetical protein
VKTKLLISLFMAAAISATAQITNNGFENWSTTGSYEEPDGWATMNPYCSGSFYSCTKSTDHYPANIGSYSIRLENNTSLTQFTGGWGISVTDTMAYPFEPAFPISGHPTSLTGWAKYAPLNGDSMIVSAYLFENGAIVSNGSFYGGSAPTWTSFEIPFSTYSNADSATVFLFAFKPATQTDGPNGNSVLYVDNLNFDELITGVEEQAAVEKTFEIYPNPASDFITLKTNTSGSSKMILSFYNAIGKLIRSENITSVQQQIHVDDLTNGIYVLKISSEEGTRTQKLIVQR